MALGGGRWIRNRQLVVLTKICYQRFDLVHSDRHTRLIRCGNVRILLFTDSKPRVRDGCIRTFASSFNFSNRPIGGFGRHTLRAFNVIGLRYQWGFLGMRVLVSFESLAADQSKQTLTEKHLRRMRGSSRPVVASRQYTWPSPEPAKTRPSQTVGEARIGPPVRNAHCCVPRWASRHRMQPSSPVANT